MTGEEEIMEMENKTDITESKAAEAAGTEEAVEKAVEMKGTESAVGTETLEKTAEAAGSQAAVSEETVETTARSWRLPSARSRKETY